MSLLSSILLGLIQGVAEFLPISSSGHLAIAEHLLGMSGASDIPEFFDVLLHLGTLLAVFVAYWDDIRDMVLEFFRGVSDLAHRLQLRLRVPRRQLVCPDRLDGSRRPLHHPHHLRSVAHHPEPRRPRQ